MAAEEVGVRARIKGSRKFIAESYAMARGIEGIGDAADRADKRIMGLNARVTLLRNVVRLVRPFALITGLGVAAQGASALAAGATAAASALSPLVGLMAAGAGAGFAVAQGFKVWSFATQGLMAAVGGLHDVLNEKKMAHLTPQAQAFARALDMAKAPVLDLQAAVQDGLFPGLLSGLKTALPLVRLLKPALAGTGTVLGTLAKSAAGAARSMGGDLLGQLQFGNKLIPVMGGAVIDLAHALMDVLVAARPLTMWAVKLAAAWASGIRDWAKAGRESGRLAGFFDQTRWAATRVLSIFGSMFKAFRNIAKAAMPLGREILWALDKAAASFAAWTGSAKGKNTLAKYFRDAKPLVFEIGRLVRDVAKAFFTLGNQPGADKLVRMIRTGLLPALVDMTNNITGAFGPKLVAALVNVAKLADGLAGATGPITMMVYALGSIAGWLGWFINNVPLANVLFAALFTTMAGAKITSMLVTPFNNAWKALQTTKAMMVALGNTTLVLRARLWLLALAEGGVSGAAAAMWAAMTGPVGLAVLAILAVVGVFVLLYNKVDWFRNAVDRVWSWITNNWPTLAAVFLGPLGGIVTLITHFDKLKDAAKGAWEAVKGAPGKVAGAAKGAVSGFVGRIGRGVGNALIPGQANGGITRRSGVSWVGEKGPELLSLPRGARVDPLPRVNGGGGGSTVPDVAGGLAGVVKFDMTVRVPVQIGDRQVTEVVAKVARSANNRK